VKADRERKQAGALRYVSPSGTKEDAGDKPEDRAGNAGEATKETTPQAGAQKITRTGDPDRENQIRSAELNKNRSPRASLLNG
jgi:hypothetical protein